MGFGCMHLRYNGMLASIPNNNHSIEVQLMNWFTSDSKMFYMYITFQSSSLRKVDSKNYTPTHCRNHDQ